jgi:hypothetical protein
VIVKTERLQGLRAVVEQLSDKKRDEFYEEIIVRLEKSDLRCRGAPLFLSILPSTLFHVTLIVVNVEVTCARSVVSKAEVYYRARELVRDGNHALRNRHLQISSSSRSTPEFLTLDNVL